MTLCDANLLWGGNSRVMVGRGCMHYLHRFLGVKIVPLSQIISLVSNYFDFISSHTVGGLIFDPQFLPKFGHTTSFDDAFCLHAHVPLFHCENTTEQLVQQWHWKMMFWGVQGRGGGGGGHIQLYGCQAHWYVCYILHAQTCFLRPHNNTCRYHDHEVSTCLCLQSSLARSLRKPQSYRIEQGAVYGPVPAEGPSSAQGGR